MVSHHYIITGRRLVLWGSGIVIKKRRGPAAPDKEPLMALYLRVSTEEQAQEGFSLDAQLKRMKAYCTAQGYNIYKVYREEGESGRTIKRPRYQAMMEAIKSWDGILIMKMDRIHRNSRNFMEMMDILGAKNKLFVSMQETLDTSTAMGRFVMDIIQRIAQLESEQTGERVHMGMTQKATTDAPGICGFNAPFGYAFEDKQLVVVDDEAAVVKSIFQLYQKGRTLDKIAAVLNRGRGLASPGGKQWTRPNVAYILNNPVYAGWLEWDGHLKKADHEPIICVKGFNLAQNRRRKPRYIKE